MKQIILENRKYERLGQACPARLAVTWGLYGLGMALLWQLAGPWPWAQAMAWAVALLAGLALLVRTGEV
jgi:hypothetical protein